MKTFLTITAGLVFALTVQGDDLHDMTARTSGASSKVIGRKLSRSVSRAFIPLVTSSVLCLLSSVFLARYSGTSRAVVRRLPDEGGYFLNSLSILNFFRFPLSAFSSVFSYGLVIGPSNLDWIAHPHCARGRSGHRQHRVHFNPGRQTTGRTTKKRTSMGPEPRPYHDYDRFVLTPNNE